MIPILQLRKQAWRGRVTCQGLCSNQEMVELGCEARSEAAHLHRDSAARLVNE